MKKIISIFGVMVLALSMLVGCSTGSTGNKKEDGKISIVTTIFPEYDWVREIIKGNENERRIFSIYKYGSECVLSCSNHC